MRTPRSTTTRCSHRLSLTLHHPRPGQVLARAHGELDAGTTGALRALLHRAGSEPHPATGRVPTHVVCDLSGVTFLSATGAGALIESGEAARRTNTFLQLVACTRPVLRVLELCGVNLPTGQDLVEVLDACAPHVPTPWDAP